MSGIAVCTDSSALLAEEEAARLGIAVVPVSVTLDGEEVDERAVDAFYERLARGAAATTSQPSPGAFLRAYAEAAERGVDEIVSVHLDARLSGTCGSALLAGGEAPIPVTVLDTRTVSFGVGVCAREAAALVAAGATVGDVERRMSELGPSLQNAFVAAHALPGRVGAAASRGVLAFSDGEVRPLAEAATVEEACAVIVDLVAAAKGPVRAAVGHASGAVQPAADQLAGALRELPRVTEVERYRVGPSVGAHTGPRSFGAFWWPGE